MILAVALLAAQTATGDGDNLKPAPQTTILAAAHACIGTTVDPAGEAARIAGWSDASPARKAGMTTDGRVVTRDNVILIEKPGIDGGCVIQARAAPDFDKAGFLTSLGAATGTAIATDDTSPVTNLPNGEIMIVQIGGEAGATYVQIVVANPKGKHAHVPKGN